MKIIAIKTLENSNIEHTKVLAKGQLYYLCNNFKIDGDDKIIETNHFPENFFSKGRVNINVQAVVGKNGSGKSTLIELLIMAINNIAYKNIEITADLVEVRDLNLEIYYKTDTFYKANIGKEISFFKYDGRNHKINIPISNEKFNLRNFFYSVVVNYSHYAYNINDMTDGEWLSEIFHKNDGYRTPIVLNPYRNYGNIDINSENHLAKSRLIANLLRDSKDKHFRKISANNLATHLSLTVNRNSKRYKSHYKKDDGKKDISLKDMKIDENLLLAKLDEKFKFGFTKITRNKYKVLTDYIVYKLVSIALKYYNYDEIYFIKEIDSFDDNKIDDFINKLYEDKSHITLKIRQTINLLKFQHIALDNHVVSLDELSSRNSEILSKRNNYEIEAIELIPPPIFNVDILFSIQDNSDPISFKLLSSGEKQMIYSVSSILYHVLNLESVPNNSRNRIKYRFINVILEEVEMYAHPEMQRTYVKYILDSIEELSLMKTIGINLCFVTHSPFILSDIPENNILFLNENGGYVPVNQYLKTFGGNIHDLLSHSFFLNQGLIGAFAFNKINDIILRLSTGNPNIFNEDSKAELLYNINIIGEQFLRNKLLDMYYEKFDKEKRIQELQAELAKLQSI